MSHGAVVAVVNWDGSKSRDALQKMRISNFLSQRVSVVGRWDEPIVAARSNNVQKSRVCLLQRRH